MTVDFHPAYSALTAVAEEPPRRVVTFLDARVTVVQMGVKEDVTAGAASR